MRTRQTVAPLAPIFTGVSSEGAPLLATPLYGLRTWSVIGEPGAERLAAPHRGTPWPSEGAWLEAVCEGSEPHEPPERGCNCGLHAWHPAAIGPLVLAGRRGSPRGGAAGAIEVTTTAFALREAVRRCSSWPVSQRAAGATAARAYGAQVVEVDDAEDVLAFCRSRGLGLDEPTVSGLLGPQVAEERRRAKREKTRRDALRLAAVVAVAALLVAAGLQFIPDPPGERVLKGRTGEIRVNSR